MELSPIDKALKTWYKPDSPLYRDPEHPTIKLAGEIGELLDLYAKHKYKSGFDWMDCKHCKRPLVLNHTKDTLCLYHGKEYTRYASMVLDELGDIWYYLRILAWMNDIKLEHESLDLLDTLVNIEAMYDCANLLLKSNGKDGSELLWCYHYFSDLLANFDCTLDQLTELNYVKLNKNEDNNHGWKDAA